LCLQFARETPGGDDIGYHTGIIIIMTVITLI